MATRPSSVPITINLTATYDLARFVSTVTRPDNLMRQLTAVVFPAASLASLTRRTSRPSPAGGRALHGRASGRP